MEINFTAAPTRLKLVASLTVVTSIAAVAIVAAPLGSLGAYARDLGQWQNDDPQIMQWFRALMQPDTFPPISCCGEADAYWADKVEIEPQGEMIAVVTDDRDDRPLMRMHEDIGSRYVVPPGKITKKDGNPTGHVLLFLGTSTWLGGQSQRPVLCYVMNTGV